MPEAKGDQEHFDLEMPSPTCPRSIPRSGSVPAPSQSTELRRHMIEHYE